jgi:hypothetical protein
MKRLALLLMFAAIAFAGDLTGKWSGSFDVAYPDGTTRPGAAYLSLKLVGQTVTGTAGQNETEQVEITNGKLEGQKLTFDLPIREATIKFDLVFDGDTIKGGAAAESGGVKLTAKVDLKRRS